METLQPHQQRVVEEKDELDKKATALSNFIGLSPAFDTLDAAEQERLREQNDVMWQYSEILGARIAAFTVQKIKDMSTDQQIEAEIQAKGLPAPRVTQADLEANITDCELVTFTSKSRQVLRWAVLTARNGFAVTGAPSCSVSPENDNPEIGQTVAIENAKRELWALMGYALKEKLHHDSR